MGETGKKVARWLGEFAGKLTRKKRISGDVMETPLQRCLGTWDLMLFGVGQMIGGGIYVLSGTVAKDNAGPAIVISLLIAGFVALLSSLCYAEFAARIPKTGSAYLFGYVTMGEFVGFVIAWQMVLENMIGAASVARAWGGYVDSMLDGAIRNSTLRTVGVVRVPLVGQIYPDFVAFAVCMVACIAVAIGVKHSARLNNVFTLVNLMVILFVIVFGFTLADSNNWTAYGFMPMGFAGVLRGAAICFFAFIGFDSIATAGEESIDPQRSIPIATLASMSIVTLSYVGVAAALTLMVPYFKINADAALPDAFAQHDLTWAKYLVAIGALSGMTTSLVGSVYALSRCCYAMACDGLLFEFFSRLNARTQVPLNAVIVFGTISAIFALLMELHVLVEFLSVGTLLAFTIVAASTIILHYQPKVDFISEEKNYGSITPTAEEAGMPPSTVAEEKQKMAGTLKPAFSYMTFLSKLRPGVAVVVGVVLMAIFTGAFCSTLVHGLGQLQRGTWWMVIMAIVFGIGLVLSFGLIIVHRQSDLNLSFQVPFVPFTPALSIFCNVVLMTNLTNMTWLRFFIWMVIGLLVYFGYGIRHSKENKILDYGTMMVVSGDDDALSLNGTIHRPQIDGMKSPGAGQPSPLPQ
ncbi:cationic amino acid transporter 4-like [Paramacrobiotus metropolitanus]|uniref:cationic amino acid transporter 4-like n=1 Tax=Paramacrobiotus metropolitanus TaxID=2943436 RepID=UPI0024463CE7|nr:cationic amino acid transporter 4-like [Paramacrobiotus metropolitanus]